MAQTLIRLRATAALVVVVVGCASTVPTAPPNTFLFTEAPTLSTPMPSAPPVETIESPIASVGATPSERPTGNTFGVTVQPDGWSRVIAAVYSASWSPDSEHFLITLATKTVTTGVDPVVGFEIRNSDGSFVSKISDEDPIGWLDETHVLAFQGLGDSSDERNYSANAHASVIGIDGSPPVPVDIPYGEGPLASGNGAVAIPRFLGHPAPHVSKYDFVVWSSAGVSAVHTGYPFMWSPDGRKLAIWHGFEPTNGPVGWLEVVSWPGLETLYEDLPHQTIGNASFDPTSSFIEFLRSANQTDVYPPNYIRIASIDGAVPADLPQIPPQTGLSSFWDGSTLETIVAGDGTENDWNSSGVLLGSRTPPADTGESSQDGSTVIYWSGGAPNPVPSFIVDRNSDEATYDLPTQHVYFPTGALAPDGSALIVVGDDAVYVRTI